VVTFPPREDPSTFFCYGCGDTLVDGESRVA
jgi:hypothetical protein